MTTEPINVEEGLALLAKANGPPWFIREKPMLDGLSVIEDGRAHGMFRVTGERFEIELIVWLVNNATALLASQQQLAEAVEVLVENATCLGTIAKAIGFPRKDGSARLAMILEREAIQQILIAGNNARDFLTKHRREG